MQPSPVASARRPQRPAMLVAIIGCLIACVVLAAIAMAVPDSPVSLFKIRATPTQPKPTPHATSTPAGPQPIASATLGGTHAAFIAKFGGAIDPSGLTFTASVAGVKVYAFIELRGGLDGQDHIYTVYVQPLLGSNASWSVVVSKSITQAFLPPDATHVHDVPLDNSLGTEYVYRSNTLAATFPMSAFTTHDGSSLVPPGSLDVQCINGSADNQITLCIIGVGTL